MKVRENQPNSASATSPVRLPNAPVPASTRLPIDQLQLKNPDPTPAAAEKQSVWSKLVAIVKTPASALGEWIKDRGGLVGVVSSAIFGISPTASPSIVVENDPSHANQLTPGDISASQTLVQKDARQESSALELLSTQEQKAYTTLRKQLEHAPVALRGLQALLLDGRLTGNPLSESGKTLLQHLTDLSTQPLAEGIDRKHLLAHTVMELENPVRVAQHNLQTCGATTAQILLIRENPAEYARIISGLAGPKGAVQLAGGKTLQRETGWNPPNDRRTLSSQLFQSTVMELSSVLDYDPSSDRHGIGPLKPMQGLFGGGLKRAIEQLTGANYTNHTSTLFTRSRVWNKVKEAIAEGRGPVPVAAWWGKNGHFVQIDRIEQGRVYYTNPWGRAESMSESDFRARLMQAQIREK